MTDNLTQPAPAHLATPPGRLELAIAAWLNAKAGRSQSSGTREKYERTLHSYQAALQLVGLDLDSSEAKAMGLVAQEWAARRSENSHWSGEVGP